MHLCSYVRGNVYVGLEEGNLSVVDPVNPRCDMHVGEGPVRFCVCVMGEVWVGCEDTLYRLDPESYTLKVCERVLVFYYSILYMYVCSSCLSGPCVNSLSSV